MDDRQSQQYQPNQQQTGGPGSMPGADDSNQDDKNMGADEQPEMGRKGGEAGSSGNQPGDLQDLEDEGRDKLEQIDQQISSEEDALEMGEDEK